MRSASAIIVSYRTPGLTLAAVKSALAAGPAEVIVVDNASGDETLHLLRQLDAPRLKVVESAKNLGFGSAANLGAAKATRNCLIFLNSDAELTATAATALLAELARWEGRAIAGPRLTSPDGSVQRSAGLLPGPFDLAVRALGLHNLARPIAKLPVVGNWVHATRTAREYASAETSTATIGTTMVSGACFAIGRRAFHELGAFDERFFMYFEDADLCRRAAAAGMPIRFVPAAAVRHIWGGSSAEDYHFGPLHMRSMRQYLAKWYGRRGTALAFVLAWFRLAGFAMTLRRDRAKRAFLALIALRSSS